jgi:hypothetical protein
VYDERQLLRTNYFWFDQAHRVAFIVNDCMVYAVNAAFRHPIFVMREQVHRLACLRQKKDEDEIIDKKVETGYPLALFQNLIMKEGRTFEFICDKELLAEGATPATAALRLYVEDQMLNLCLDEELLLIGTFLNDDGLEVQHASTFIRLECGLSREAVIVHLDSNCDYPQCTKRSLLKQYMGEIADLEWKQFDRYSQILVYRLSTNYLFDDAEIAKKTKFIKNIV